MKKGLAAFVAGALILIPIVLAGCANDDVGTPTAASGSAAGAPADGAKGLPNAGGKGGLQPPPP